MIDWLIDWLIDLGRNIEKLYYLIFVRKSVSGLRLVDLAGSLSSSNIDGVDGVWTSHFNPHRSFYDFISLFLLSFLVSIVGYIKPRHSKQNDWIELNDYEYIFNLIKLL